MQVLGEKKKRRSFYCFASALFIVGMCQLIGISKYRQFFWNRHRQKFWNRYIPSLGRTFREKRVKQCLDEFFWKKIQIG